MDIENSSGIEFDELILMHIILARITKYMIKVLCRILGLNGELWVEDIINSHPKRYQEQFRMPAAIFLSLKRWICIHAHIHNSRKQKGVSVKQKLAIFLWITDHDVSNQDAQE